MPWLMRQCLATVGTCLWPWQAWELMPWLNICTLSVEYVLWARQVSGVSQQGRCSVCSHVAGREGVSFMLRMESVSEVKEEGHKTFPESIACDLRAWSLEWHYLSLNRGFASYSWHWTSYFTSLCLGSSSIKWESQKNLYQRIVVTIR